MTGQPISGARLHLFLARGGDPAERSGRVAPPITPDADGYFGFTGLPAHSYSLQAELPHELVRYGETEDPLCLLGDRRIEVGPKSEGKTLTFRIWPQAVFPVCFATNSPTESKERALNFFGGSDGMLIFVSCPLIDLRPTIAANTDSKDFHQANTCCALLLENIFMAAPRRKVWFNISPVIPRSIPAHAFPILNPQLPGSASRQGRERD